MSVTRVRLQIVPLELRDANAFVSAFHRHHAPSQGHRFSLGAVDVSTMRLCAVGIVGRPVARMLDFSRVLEVVRMCSDGTFNACSFIYSAAARVGRELGFERIQTYILDSENGTSLLAAGWTCDLEEAGGGQWIHTSGPRRTDQPICTKRRFVKTLNVAPPRWTMPPEMAELRTHAQPELF